MRQQWLRIIGTGIFVLLASGLSNAAQPVKPKPGAATAAAKATAGKSSILVTFVELGSVNCIPCKMMQPVMEEIEKQYGNQVRVVFHDVWTAAGRPYAGRYRIRAIPTQVFLDKNGKEYFRHTGFFPKDEIVKVLKMQGVQ